MKKTNEISLFLLRIYCIPVPENTVGNVPKNTVQDFWEHLGTLLKSFTGYLQSDGWRADNVFDKEDQVCLVSCIVHI